MMKISGWQFDYRRWAAFSAKNMLSGFLLASAVNGAQAAVNEIFPADSVAPLPGSLIATGYLFQRDFSGPYKNGNTAGDWDFDSSVAALRLTYGMEAGGYVFTPILVLSGARSEVTGSRLPGGDSEISSSGLGDPRFATTLWLLNQAQENHYLSITGMVIPPLGSYDADEVFNIGENRWRAVALMGWQRGWTPQWITEFTGEAAWHGANDEYVGNNRLEQAPSFALTGYLRYKFTPDFHGFAGMQLNTGGATEINGLDQHNPPRNQRLMLGLFYKPEPSITLNLRYGQDMAVENGLHTDHEVALRLVKVF